MTNATPFINVPADSVSYITFLGWLVNYELPTYLLLPSVDSEQTVLADLRSIGIDYVPGYFSPEVAAHDTQALPVITARELAKRLPQNGMTLIDVRGKGEFDARHVAGARHLPLGYLADRLPEIPRSGTVITLCASGYRSQIAASLLQANGFDNVVTLNEGEEYWTRFLPTESGVALVTA